MNSKSEPVISLSELESIFFRENRLIDPWDVASLMVVIYEAAGVELPKRILDDAISNNSPWQ